MEIIGNQSESERLARMENDIADIKTALLGSEFNKSGYISKVDQLTNRVQKLEDNARAQLWFFLGSGAVGGAGAVKLIESLFNH